MDKQADVLKQSACQLEAYTAANRRSLYVAPYLLGRNCAKSISSALKAVDIEQSLALCKTAHKIALQQAGGSPPVQQGTETAHPRRLARDGIPRHPAGPQQQQATRILARIWQLRWRGSLVSSSVLMEDWSPRRRC